MNPFRRLIVLLRPEWHLVLAAAVCSAVASASLLSLPLLVKSLLDVRDGPAAHQILLPAVLALALLSSSYCAYTAMFTAARRITAGIRTTYCGHLLSLPVSFHRTHPAGDLTGRFTAGLADIEWFLRYTLLTAIILALLFLGTGIMLFLISWRLTLLQAFITGLSIAVISRLLAVSRRATAAENARNGRRSSDLQEMLSAIEIVKAFGAEQRELARVAGKQPSPCQGDRIFAFMEPLIFTVAITAVLAIAVAGGMLIARGDLSVQDFIAYLMYSLLLLPQARSVSLILVRWQHFNAAWERIGEILAVRPEPTGLPPAPPELLPGPIRLSKVTVTYPGGTTALTDVSFSIGPREAVGIVGESGAGKSTVFNLLLRFVDPAVGTVSFGAADTAKFDPRSVRRFFAVVPQDPFLFNTTVAENLLYGNPGADESRLREALRLAHAEEFVERLPEGLRTTVGERGGKLSAGQRQRIAIARAFLSDAPVILLDEATSSLDSGTEFEIRLALAEIMARRTVLIIAHRLATVIHLPRILVFDRGRVIDEGTHDRLNDRCGKYRRLVQTQFIAAEAHPAEAERLPIA